MDPLSRRPDYKEGIAVDNVNQVLLDPKFFKLQAVRPTSVQISGNSDLQKCIKDAQELDKEVSKAIGIILKNGPRMISKILEDWNMENGIILYKGHVYVSKDLKL